MNGFVTDRQQSNVDRLKELSSKGWANMTAAEKAEWVGDPLQTVGANLFPREAPTRLGVSVTYRLDHMILKSENGGTFQYAPILLGLASDFEGKTVTLSVDSVSGTPSTYPRIGLFWHNSGGVYEAAGVQLNGKGSVTLPLNQNAQNRQFLAAYVYVSTSTAVEVGATVRYNGVMVTVGNTKYPFVPYTEIVATPATKGAYNYSDLNRVELAVAELSDMYGLGLMTKTNWTPTDVPTEVEMNRYLANVRRIRTICPNPGSLPLLPASPKGMNYEVANNIEKILVAAYEGAIGTYRSGELYSGEV